MLQIEKETEIGSDLVAMLNLDITGSVSDAVSVSFGLGTKEYKFGIDKNKSNPTKESNKVSGTGQELVNPK